MGGLVILVLVDTKVVVPKGRDLDRKRAPRPAVDRLARELAKIRPREEKQMAEEGLVELSE